MTVGLDRDGLTLIARSRQPEPAVAAWKLPFRLVVAATLVGGSAAALVTTAANVRYAAIGGAEASCGLTKVWNEDASGRIVRFLSTGETAAMVQNTEVFMGGKMSPRYEPYRAAGGDDR